MELLICVGLIDAGIFQREEADETFPEEVLENWKEKLDTILEFLQQQQAEVVEFGSAFEA